MDQAELEFLERAVSSDEPHAEHVLFGNGWGVVRLGSGRKRNAITLTEWQALADTFIGWAVQGEPRTVVVRGNGGLAFSAGADIGEFPALRIGLKQAAIYNEAVSDAVHSIASYPWPVVAMVNGLAVGGGCELAAACDVRMAASHALLGIPISRLGVILGVTETQALLRLIGPARLKWLILSGALIDADRALQFGLVETVVEQGMLADATLRLVSDIINGSLESIRATKHLIDLCWRTRIPRDVEQIIPMALAAYESPSYRDRVTDFLKRSKES